MIASMTGCGSAEAACGQWSVRVEARSVNHGELKICVRLPDILRSRENDVVNLGRGRLVRGQVTLHVRCNLGEETLTLLVDRERLTSYVKLVREVAAAEGLPVHVEVGSLLGLPGVLGAESVPDEVRDGLWPLVVQAAEAALDELIGMKRAEGENLARDIETICDRIRERAEAVVAGLDKGVRATQARLEERVERLLEGRGVTVDKEFLAREVAFLAERGDVAEELTRMNSHLAQFRGAVASDKEAVGKKLEFLVQEMLREANTMASKLPTSDLVQQAVEIKTDVHRLREQVRNVE